MTVLLSRRRVGLGLLVMGVGLGLLEILGFATTVRSPGTLALSAAGIAAAVAWPFGGYLLMRRDGTRGVVMLALGLLIAVHLVQIAVQPVNVTEQLAFIAVLGLCFLSGAVAR